MKKNKHNTDESFEEFFIDIDEPIYTSGVVSRLLSIPVWVLKQLDREEIVSPPRKRGKSRLYSKREIKKVHYIWNLMSEKNVNIGGVRVIIEMNKEKFEF